MSAQPVDVLAVLDNAAIKLEVNRFPSIAAEVAEARAAVAELIAAAEPCVELVESSMHFPDDFGPEKASRLRDALARCGGAR